MRRTRLLFLSLGLLLATGCSDKKEDNHATGKEVTLPAPSQAQEYPATPERNQTVPKKTASEKTAKPEAEAYPQLQSMTGTHYRYTIEGDRFKIHENHRPLLLINFFATWCPPCYGQIPYFEDLQKKYKEKLFVTGILVNDDSNSSSLKHFYKTYHADYFIADRGNNREITEQIIRMLHLEKNMILPLTILYKDGRYYTHYEGAVPIEMIDHDLEAALQTN